MIHGFMIVLGAVEALLWHVASLGQIGAWETEKNEILSFHCTLRATAHARDQTRDCAC